MEIGSAEQGRKLRLQRLQVIETGEGLLLKRGRVVVQVQGAQSAQIAQALLTIAAEGEATRTELTEPFPPPVRPAVEQLIDMLESRRLLSDASRAEPMDRPEEPLDVFYWHFDRQVEEVARSFARARITVLGVNCVSRRLVEALRQSGMLAVEVVDYPLLANVRLFREEGQPATEHWPEWLGDVRPYRDWLNATGGRETGCLVATSDFGGQHLLRTWNEHCLREGVQFLPVVLQDLIGTVGPLVVPGESACLECLRARENAQMDDPETRRTAEYAAYQGQVVSAFHPSMASILGDIAAMELVKLHGHVMRSRLVGRLIEVNLALPAITERRVLKLPRCAACGSVTHRSPVSGDSVAFMPGHEVVR
ncbi:MAG TPA: TOMM precursor leader peptide-binding protein [Acetobacteraceae bacterium]|jgi:bacteriocin biosynthesis cyclodehydratase domain-containing protein